MIQRDWFPKTPSLFESNDLQSLLTAVMLTMLT
jgi:hypothetical protein